MNLKETFREVDDVDLIGRVRDHLDLEVSHEFAELERRFWCHKLGELAARQGMSLGQFFARRMNES